jgi:aryl-alcohol dehydrogenase-like predicted oxidoreductase
VVQAVLTAADGLGTSPLAVALAWVRDRPGVVAPIVGARDAAQLAGSLAAEGLELPPAIRSALDDVSAP